MIACVVIGRLNNFGRISALYFRQPIMVESFQMF